MAVREAADLLGVSRQRVHQLIAQGRIAARRYGGRAVIVEAKSVTAFAQARGPRRRGGRPPLRSGGLELACQPDWMPVSEAAEALGVSCSRVHQLVKSGTLSAMRWSSYLLLVKRASVQAYGPRGSSRRRARPVT
jgi:excisionase family DNA binding protein